MARIELETVWTANSSGSRSQLGHHLDFSCGKIRQITAVCGAIGCTMSSTSQ